MVGVAQLVERRVVVADVAGSSPVTHPTVRYVVLALASRGTKRRHAHSQPGGRFAPLGAPWKDSIAAPMEEPARWSTFSSPPQLSRVRWRLRGAASPAAWSCAGSPPPTTR